MARGPVSYEREIARLKDMLARAGETALQAKQVILRLPHPTIDKMPEGYHDVVSNLEIVVAEARSHGQKYRETSAS